jgi:hypothetical protein
MSGAARHGVILLALTPPHARTDGAARTHLPPWRPTPDVGLASELGPTVGRETPETTHAADGDDR